VFERILMAVDEHEDPTRLLELVAGLGKAFSSHVVVFHVRERWVFSNKTVETESIPEAHAFGHQIAERLIERGVEAGAEVENSRPDVIGARILAKAAEMQADLIVIGGHHSHSTRERLLGDIGKVLAHGAHCPVLLMPSPP